MQDDEWIKKLTDGRRVKFSYQGLPEETGTFITAQLGTRRSRLFGLVIVEGEKPHCNRQEVESHFSGELSKK